MSTDDQTCATCRHAHPDDLAVGSSTFRSCRRYPARVRVAADYGCGEWETEGMFMDRKYPPIYLTVPGPAIPTVPRTGEMSVAVERDIAGAADEDDLAPRKKPGPKPKAPYT